MRKIKCKVILARALLAQGECEPLTPGEESGAGDPVHVQQSIILKHLESIDDILGDVVFNKPPDQRIIISRKEPHYKFAVEPVAVLIP